MNILYPPRARLFLLLVAVSLLPACAPHKPYRTTYTLCVSESPATECDQHALQELRSETSPEQAYTLGFIEFDDQGQLWDRGQMRSVLDHLFTMAAPEQDDLLMVVFVHGWKHSAAPGDGNIQTFREVLRHLSAAESSIGQIVNSEPRRVAGIYLGWRGASVTAPVLKELTFWDRKNTAHKVGRGGVTEVLNRIELVRTTKDAVAGGSRTRLVVVGHSFGGAVVYSALSQILENGFVHTMGPAGQSSDVRGFGNLVVLINPAFEALRYSPLSDMSTERGSYFDSQLPVLLVLTSEADMATKRAFPAGRWFSTLFEKDREVQRPNGVTGEIESVDQHQANITAVGHFDPYMTHHLNARQTDDGDALTTLSVERSVQLFFETSQTWENDTPGSRIQFPSSELLRTETSAGRNPYLNVRVDGELIKDHNDIDDPRIIEFVTQLILISNQSDDPKQRMQIRSMGLGE